MSLNIFPNEIFTEAKRNVENFFSEVKDTIDDGSKKLNADAITMKDYNELMAKYKALEKKYITLEDSCHKTAEWGYNSTYEDYSCSECGNTERRRTSFCSSCGCQMVEKVVISSLKTAAEEPTKTISDNKD